MRHERLAESVRDLDAKARHHKREAARHRQMAREARERQAELEAECRRLGIGCRVSGKERSTARTEQDEIRD